MNVSYLYTPVLRADSLIAKRHGVLADVVVLDLEDSIHVTAKAAARQKLAELDLTPLTELGIRIGLRINPIFCFDGLADLAVVESICARADHPLGYLFVPKVRHASEVRIYRTLVETLPAAPKLVTFIETAEAVDNADEIAAASDVIHYGQADLLSELYSPNPAYLDYARARVCVAAARYGIEAIDTNSFELHDMAVVEADCVAGKGYGFTGKAAIHPRQVPVINAVFTVAKETINDYQATVDAYAEAEAGFRVVDGEVIAPPFVAKARRMLALYQT